MQNPLLDKIKVSIENGSWWQATINDAAESFLGSVKNEVIDIAVMGDFDYTNVRSIANHISHLRNYLDDKQFYRIIVGNRSGVEEIVARICEVNAIPYQVISLKSTKTNSERLLANEELNDVMVKQCVGLMMITRGKDTTLSKVFDKAKLTGRAVTRRIVRAK